MLPALLFMATLAGSPHWPTADGGGGGAHPADTTLALDDDVPAEYGTGADYWQVYNSTGTQWELWTTDADGVGGDEVVLAIPDGTDDLVMDVGTKLYWDNDLGEYMDSTGNDLRFYAAGALRADLNANDFTAGQNNNSFRIELGSPSATLPTYAFKGDTNTGMFRDATADVLRFAAGGVEALTITESGAAITAIDMNGPVNPTSGVNLTGGTELCLDGVGGGECIKQTTAGRINFHLNDADTIYMNAGSMSSETVGSWFMDNAASTSTNPAFAFNSDTDTGVGSAAADQVSLIAGAVEMMRLTEGTDDYVETYVPFRHDTNESTTPAEPFACAAGTVGMVQYVDDTDDGGAAALCVCLDADDGTTLDWRRVDDNAAACPFF